MAATGGTHERIDLSTAGDGLCLFPLAGRSSQPFSRARGAVSPEEVMTRDFST